MGRVVTKLPPTWTKEGTPPHPECPRRTSRSALLSSSFLSGETSAPSFAGGLLGMRRRILLSSHRASPAT